MKEKRRPAELEHRRISKSNREVIHFTNEMHHRVPTFSNFTDKLKELVFTERLTHTSSIISTLNICIHFIFKITKGRGAVTISTFI